MTTVTNVVQVPLPDGAQATPDDLEVLQRLLAAIASLRYEAGREWPGIRGALVENGWNLRWGLQWHIEARRGRELEEACGRTVDEAFARVWQVTREDPALEGTP